MTQKQIRTIEETLVSFGRNYVRVLEWGSGGSTMHFTDFLHRRGIRYSWLSIEYNRDWYEAVKRHVKNDPNVKLKLFDAGNTRLRQKDAEMEEYITHPRRTGELFDLILVDGRKRRRCVLEARSMLAPRGVVFLHDAHRSYYQCALKEFEYSLFVTPHLWMGKRETVSTRARHTARLKNFCMRCYYLLVIAPYFMLRRVARRIIYGHY